MQLDVAYCSLAQMFEHIYDHKTYLQIYEDVTRQRTQHVEQY